MAKPIEEVTLESYEKMLIKANLEESKNPAGTYAILRKCFRVVKQDYNLFLETYPPRTTDIINLERRLATMKSRLHIETDDYQELEKYIANARLHDQQQRLDLVLMDYQNIIVRAEKLKQKAVLKQYRKIFKETQAEYDAQVAELKKAIDVVEESQKTKDYATALTNIDQILLIAPKLGKSEVVDEYTELRAKLEADFEKEQASLAAEEKAKREENARLKALEEEEIRKKKETDRQAFEENERKMREEMAQKKRKETLKKQQEEEERIRVEEAPLKQEKSESVAKKTEEIKEVEKKMSSENLNSTSPTEIKQITVEEILLINPVTLQELSPDHIANFSEEQLRNLTREQIQALSPEQIRYLGSEQLDKLTTKQMQYFTPEQMREFTPSQVIDFTTQQWLGLTYEQIQALEPEQLTGFTSADWEEWDPEMLRWLTKEQLPHVIRYFAEDQIKFLTPQQLSWLLDDLTDDRIEVVPQKQIQMLTQTVTKHVGEWIQWSTNIPKEESEKLLEIADILVDAQTISKANRYNLNRYALMELLKNNKK